MINKFISFFLIFMGLTLLSCSSIKVKYLSDGRRVYTGDIKKLKKGSIIEGYVVDSQTGKKIKGARVELKNANMGVGYYVRKTNWNGYFKIDNFIPHLSYILEVSADNYIVYRVKGIISEGSRKIKLVREALLSGRVRDTSGNPVKDVEVKLKRYYDSYSKPHIAVTDSNGAYSFNKLKSGSYLATFTLSGYITETARLKRIKKGEAFNLPMVLFKPASISGKITIKELDVPAVNINVSARSKATHSTSTYQDGTYQLEDVKPGRYRLYISHQGFYTMKSRVIRIREGDKSEDINFIVKPKEPKIDVYSYRYTFTPGNKVAFNLRSFRLDSVKVTIYSLPLGVLMRGGVDPDRINPQKEGFKITAKWDEPVRDFRPYDWRYQSLQVKTPLSTGGYCIEVKGAGKIISRKFFTVTSTGVVVKRSQNSLFAYVTNLITNKPVQNAKIIVFDSSPKKKYKRGHYYKPPKRIEDLPVKVLMKGNTDKDGIFHKKYKSTKHFSILAIGNDKSYAICNTGSPTSFQKEKYKYLIYTDRPVYRAGDTVSYKLIGKKRASRFYPISGKKIYYKIVNRAFNKVIKEGNLKFDQWGTAHGSVRLKPDINLGVYEIRAGPSPGKLYNKGIFYAEQYRKPEFKIDITPSKGYYINGDTMEFKVEAKYFFGAPLKGALVRYRFYETRLRDSNTSYWWESGYSGSQAYNRIKLSGEKYVDKNGIAVLRLFSGNYPYDRDVTLEATVTDPSNVSITKRKKIRVGRGEYYIKIIPKKHFFSGNEKKKIEILTRTHTGKPISADLNIKVFRYIWKPWQRVYVHDKRPMFSKKVTTNKKGRAAFSLPEKFAYYGEFDLIVDGVDKRDNTITASRVIWIYSSSSTSIASKLKNLEIALNVTKLKKPQEVTCLVKTRYKDSYVCLTLEGRDIYRYKVIKMKGNIMPVKFDIKPGYAPNLYLTAVMQRKRALFTASAGISLPVKNTTLNISIKSGKTRFRPGERAKVDIKAVDEHGKPIKADLSLSVVDEAIYQIRTDHTPKMKDFFYSRISNWVLTSYSYPITVLAGAAKGGDVKVRQDFKDTAFWKANIRTNSSGKAELTFKLPDNLTTWRLTARGHDRDGRVGEKKSKILVTQELIARIGKPRFMIEGDKIGLIGIVNSNTEQGLKSVKTEFKIGKRLISPDKKIGISLPAFGSARNFYSYTVPKNKKKIKLQFTSIADRKYSDSILLSVPVERRGVAYKLYGLGDMAHNRNVKIVPIKGTDDFDFVPEKITILVNPSPVIQMLRATKFLSEYPYGCIEQTLNRFIPNLALNRILNIKGLSQFIDKKAVKDLEKKVRVGIARLQYKQNGDGTWGWWYGDRGNAFVTGYVLYSLNLAKSSGYPIQMSRVNKGLKSVHRILRNQNVRNRDAASYLIYIYSMWGRWDNRIYNDFKKSKISNAYQLSNLIRAIAIVKKRYKLSASKLEALDSDMQKYIKRLKSMMKKDRKGIYWSSAGAQSWSWPGGNAEITAHVLSSLVEAGDRSSLLGRIVHSLSKRSRGNAWRSTKETASVILALCRYIDAIGSSYSLKGNINFSLDGKRIANIAYNLKDIKDIKTLSKSVLLKRSDAKSIFNISAGGEAGPDVSFDIIVNGTLYFKGGGMLSIFKSKERSLDALSNGIKMTRVFSALTRVQDVHRKEYLVPQKISGRKEIKVGDELLVKVKFAALDDFKYLVMEDFLPSGFEVVKKNAYDKYRPYVHIERWDNRMVFFFTDIKKGEIYEIGYIVRAELPGNFMVKPSRVECMYEPSIQGWSVPTVIEVKKK